MKPGIPSRFAFDVAVVGGGSAGFAAARTTAGAGLRTVVVEGGRELGGLCIGPHGGELIHEIVAAMHRRTTVRELAAMPHYHPMLAEIWPYPAEELAAQLPAKLARSGTSAARHRRRAARFDP